MTAYLYMFIYGLLVLGAFLGWGILMSSYILKDEKRPSQTFGFRISIGMAIVVVIGGFLNYFHAISTTSIFWIMAVGLATAIIHVCMYLPGSDFKKRAFNFGNFFAKIYRKRNIAGILIVSAIVLLSVFKYATAISPGFFNTHDDLQGYMVFSEKMIETGSIGNDPFSERRIVSSIGGKAFLDTLVLVAGSEKNLHLFDRGIGYIAFLLALFSLLNILGISKKNTLLVLFAAALYSAPMANITAIYTGSTLFVILVGYLYKSRKNENKDWRDLIIVGIVAAALCALKTSFLPVTGLLVIAILIRRSNWDDVLKIKARKVKVAQDLLISSSVFLVSILPWMWASYISSGTFMYPLLGKGYHGSAYGTFLTATSEVHFSNIINFVYSLQTILFFVIFSVFALVIFSKRMRSTLEFSDIWLVGITAGGVLLLGLATAGFAVHHYTFAFALPGVLILLARCINIQLNIFQNIKDVVAGNINSAQSGKVQGIPVRMIGIGFLMIIIGAGLQTFMIDEKQNLEFLKFGIKNMEIVQPIEREVYKGLQNAVPEGEKILVRLDKNFLLDFNRNEIYIADYPGGSSLPPGMPFFKNKIDKNEENMKEGIDTALTSGSELLAKYLIDHEIYFVAYAYKSEASFTREEYGNRLDPNMNAWIRSEAEHTFDFQDNLKVLGDTRKRVYDDGLQSVIDLREQPQTKKLEVR